MRHVLSSSLFFLLLLPTVTCGLKVLMYQISFSNTHMPYSGAIADALIERGHTVDKLILVYNSKVQTNGSTRLRNVFRIELPGGSPFAKAAHLTTPFETPPLNRREAMSIKNRRLFCERLLEDDALISRLKAEEYDVYLTIPFEYCALGLNQLLKIPSVHHYTVIQQLSQINGYSDTPRPPSFAPDVFQCEQQGKEKSFWSRLKSFLYSADVNLFPETLAAEELAYLRQKIPNLPSVWEMVSSVSYIFLNSNEILDIPQPLSPKTKYIGGITFKQEIKPLSEEMNEVLSRPFKGTVLVSFGSLIRTSLIPFGLKLELLQAFDSFPDYQFIWKVDEEDDVRLQLQNHTNVYPVAWMNQKALLNDPRVHLFVTHSGLNSYLEASYAGKPLISIPFFVDQFYNVDAMLYNEVAVYLQKEELSFETMRDALRTVLEDPKYEQNAKEIARMLRERPEDPKDVLVRSVEYAARHPKLAAVLQMQSAMPLWKYFSLDVIAFLFSAFCFSLTLVVFVLRTLLRLIVKSKVKKE